jgi:5-methylcytosine-specific restriction endonuclease McrA
MAEWPYTTQRWQRLRQLKLREHPLCQACLQVGWVEPAVAVDHWIPIKRGDDPFPHQIAQIAFVVLLGEIDFFANWRFRKSVKLDGKIRKPGLFAQPPTGLR